MVSYNSGGATLAQAATVYVTTGGNDTNTGLSWGNAFATINHAITAVTAQGGGVIEVGYGSFAPFTIANTQNSLTINGRGMGQEYENTNNITTPARVTWIDNSAASSVGITVQGPGTFSSGGGAVPTGITIQNLAVVGSAVSGDGIFINKTEQPFLLRNVAVDQCATWGLQIQQMYGGTFDNVWITRCGLASSAVPCGGLYLHYGQNNNLIFRSGGCFHNWGYGVYTDGAQGIVFQGWDFEGNIASAQAGSGSGFATVAGGANKGGPFTFDACWFENNAAAQARFGTGANGATFKFVGCVFYGDSSSPSAISIASVAFGYGVIDACLFSGHTGGYSIDNSTTNLQVVWTPCLCSDTNFMNAGIYGTYPAVAANWSGANQVPYIQGANALTRTGDGAVGMDLNLGSLQYITLAGNATSSSMAHSVNWAEITVVWAQDGTGGRTYAWPATFKFAGGASAAGASTAGNKDIYKFVYDGTNWNEVSRALAVR